MFGVIFFLKASSTAGCTLPPVIARQRRDLVSYFFVFEHVQHALAHHRHRADVCDLLPFDRLEDFLGVEFFMQDHRAAEINDPERERSSGIEINRRG